jgi:membrane protease YdiL (CAAX protease family)
MNHVANEGGAALGAPAKRTPRVPWGWARAVLFLGVFVALFGSVQELAGRGIEALSGTHPADLGRDGSLAGRLAAMASFIGFSLCFSLALAFVFCRLIDRRRLRALGWGLRGWGPGVAGGLATGAGILLVGFLILLAAGQLRVVAVDFRAGVVAGYLLITLLVALQEELVFRGYVLRNLLDSFSWVAALPLSAGLFLLIHLSGAGADAVTLANAFLGGLLLGLRYVFTLNLWFAVALHFSWNFVEGPLLGFGVSGLPVSGVLVLELEGAPRWTGGEAGFEGSVLLTLLLAVAVAAVGLHAWRQRRGTRPVGPEAG